MRPLAADSAFHELSVPYAVSVGDLLADGLLLDRALGEQIGDHLRETLRGLPPDSLLFIDMSAVRAASFAALKATFAILGRTRPAEFAARHLLVGVGTQHGELIEALDSMARSERFVIPAIDSAGLWRPFGYLPPAEKATLDFLQQAGTLTAAQVKQRFGLTMSAASNRLRLLHDRWLARRVEHPYARGGREFVYSRLEI